MIKKTTIFFILSFILMGSNVLFGQGVTTASISGIVSSIDGERLPGANVIAVHVQSGTQYGASTGTTGLFSIQNMRVGGPYSLTVSYVGFQSQKFEDIFLSVGQKLRLDYNLQSEAVDVGEVVVTGEQDDIMNSQRTGAETYINPRQVQMLPSIKRSTRDLTRLDPRSDGNFSFAGKNWLYNNISLDGSYFNNSFGLDDPAPGGQTNAEPVPYDAVEQVSVSIAPFDVREGGFTGAGINTVTKSGTNEFKASVYSFIRNESLIGNKVRGEDVIANPDLSFNQSGVSASGPIIPNKLFFFVNAEIVSREDPGSNYVADSDGNVVFGESRVSAAQMDAIRQRMIDVYGYDPGPYQGYIHETKNQKILAKLDWNINEQNHLSFRWNMLDASRDLPPHGFVLSFNNSGRGPNESSLPFQNAGYKINNEINSFALELNSQYSTFTNRFFASYNIFRDFREPFTEAFPTVEIGEGGVTYTTMGTEPFSSHNILDSDVLQITDNISFFSGDHVYTIGANFEYFKFFNSFNIFRNGLFMLPWFLDFEGDGIPNGSTFFTLDDFFNATDPSDPIDLRGMIGQGIFKGEFIEVGQFSLYAQDEFLVSADLTLTYGVRADFPMYFTDPVENPFSTGLVALDENDDPELVDQAKLPGRKALYSPRIGFNWDVYGDKTTQLRGGTGIFTGRLPFVWIGNVISNPGANPNLYPTGEIRETKDNSTLMQSFDLNAMDRNFSWPQVWTTNLAIDQILPWDMTGTLEVVYGKDINSIYVRNADLDVPVRHLPDGRPYYGSTSTERELNEFYPDENAGIYVIDNSDKGYNFNITAQLRKRFDFGMNVNLGYSYTKAENLMKSTEIASVLWQANPTKGDPNKPELAPSEFGQRHRIIGSAYYKHVWSENLATSIGLFLEIAEGNRYIYSGGNRYSFTYGGDINGDGYSGNDLIYIPEDESEIHFVDYIDGNGATVTAAQQWTQFNSFIEQDDYLSENRGSIADRNGLINPWYFNLDLRILQDFSFMLGNNKQTFQLSIDILNFPNLISSDWGVRKIARASAIVPLEHTTGSNGTMWADDGGPYLHYKGGDQETFIDDPSVFSRWQIQVGLRYMFN
ncbi:carboxypeptidase regulatory-like domain-containing protein [Bacteroidota bacterium]